MTKKGFGESTQWWCYWSMAHSNYLELFNRAVCPLPSFFYCKECILDFIRKTEKRWPDLPVLFSYQLTWHFQENTNDDNNEI